MKTIEITTINQTKAMVTEVDFQKSIIDYLQKFSPDRVMIIAVERNDTGQPEMVPTAILMLAKNPSEVKFYTNEIALENQEKEGGNVDVD